VGFELKKLNKSVEMPLKNSSRFFNQKEGKKLEKLKKINEDILETFREDWVLLGDWDTKKQKHIDAKDKKDLI